MGDNIYPPTFDATFASQTASQPERSVESSRQPVGVSGAGDADVQLPEREVTEGRGIISVTGSGDAIKDIDGRTVKARREIIGLQSQWQIDGTPVRTVTAEVKENDVLSLTLRVERSVFEQTIRPLKSDEGKVNTLTTDDGGYVAIDRADGDNTYNITPHIDRYSLRRKGIYHVARYEERVIEQTGDEWDVELELTPDADRTDAPSISQTPASDEFGLATRYGEIATDSVDAQLEGTGQQGVERIELTTRLTFDQAHVFEAALSRIGGTRIKEVPDATNTARDETDDDANTLTITSPDQDTISDGDYAVLEWESERLNDAYQQVSFTVAPL